MQQSILIIAIICGIIFFSEWLVNHTFLKKIGSALLVIIFGSIASNFGLIPTSSSEAIPVQVYDIAFTILAPLSIFLFLLQVNLKDLRKAGAPIIILFFIGSIGTCLGVILGMKIINGETSIGPMYNALAGMYTGTYTGGSINFNALAFHYDAMENGVLYTAAVVVDNIVTALWMIVTLGAPVVLRKYWGEKNETKIVEKEDDINQDEEKTNPSDIAITLAIGLFGVYFSDKLSYLLSDFSISIPPIIVLTVMALIMAQFSIFNKIRGIRVLAMFSVYIFLTVIGAYCDVYALSSAGGLGSSLLILALTIMLVHGTLLFGMAKLLKMDLSMVSVASQANVGGGTTALAVARSLGRNDLVLPAILIGSLGNAVGTFLGLWVAGIV